MSTIKKFTHLTFLVKKLGGLKKFSLVAILALALVLGSAGAAQATLTFDATNVTGDGAVTIDGVVGSVYTIGTAANTGGITLGNSTVASTIAIGNGAATAAQTVNIANGAATAALTVGIGTAATGAGTNLVTIGGTNGASTTAIQGGTGATAITLTPATAGTIVIGGTGHTGGTTVISSNASALAVGRLGATTPALNVDASATTSVTGLNIAAGAAAGGLGLSVIGGGTNENLTINAKGSGTIGIGTASTGVITLARATSVTGALTPTGGVAAAGGFSNSARLVHSGGKVPALYNHSGETSPSVTETYIVEIFIPANMTVTGVSLLIGWSTAGNYKISLADSTGAPIAAAVTASTAGSTTQNYQRIPFVVPYEAKGPATYYILLQSNNTGNSFRTHLLGDFGASVKTGETYGTFTTVTPPTTFTASGAAIASLY